MAASRCDGLVAQLRQGLEETALIPEIEQNDFNLNTSRYVSTAQAEEEIDLQAVHAELEVVERTIGEAKQQHKNFLAELGLPPLP